MKRILSILCLVLALAASSCGHHKNVPVKGKEYEQVINKEKKGKKKGKKKRYTDARRMAIVDEAHKWLGTAYRYGGNERSGTDCSGMVMRVFDDAVGIKLPRNSRKQCAYCRKIDPKELVPADLVFFSSKNSRGAVTHVGVYIGDGKFIHASTSQGVITSSLDERYYIRNFIAAGRVPLLD